MTNMNTLTKVIITSLLTISLSACVAKNPYNSDDPVDQSLKICGLGYSSEAANLYRGAYDFSQKKVNVEFETSMKQSLKTQLTSMYEAMKPTDKDSLKSISDQIDASRSCVLTQIDNHRPRTRSELVTQCMDDLKKRVGDTGNGYPAIRYYAVDERHTMNSVDNIVVRFDLEFGGSNNKQGMVSCKVRNNQYYDLIPTLESN
ncbi:hypothetical protein [Buttiauxella gaviniae]|uniref:hypothetical protein n=1 Tax=Buttiauxella gaviniae TaxID=82990 RepID=UPI003BB4F8FC